MHISKKKVTRGTLLDNLTVEFYAKKTDVLIVSAKYSV